MDGLQPLRFAGVDPRRPLVVAGPCSAETEEQTLATARRLAAEGRAVVMVLHDLCLALQYAHRTALLQDGRLVLAGAPDELYQSHALERVMGVELGQIKTEGGPRYYYR